MFYLTMHSTHFILSYLALKERRMMGERNEGSVLFNDALDTFSYGYMASDIW